MQLHDHAPVAAQVEHSIPAKILTAEWGTCKRQFYAFILYKACIDRSGSKSACTRYIQLDDLVFIFLVIISKINSNPVIEELKIKTHFVRVRERRPDIGVIQIIRNC